MRLINRFRKKEVHFTSAEKKKEKSRDGWGKNPWGLNNRAQKTITTVGNLIKGKFKRTSCKEDARGSRRIAIKLMIEDRTTRNTRR